MLKWHENVRGKIKWGDVEIYGLFYFCACKTVWQWDRT